MTIFLEILSVFYAWCFWYRWLIVIVVLIAGWLYLLHWIDCQRKKRHRYLAEEQQRSFDIIRIRNENLDLRKQCQLFETTFGPLDEAAAKELFDKRQAEYNYAIKVGIENGNLKHRVQELEKQLAAASSAKIPDLLKRTAKPRRRSSAALK